MSKISVKYNGELRVNLTHTLSKKSIITDAPLDNNGLGMSFSPTDLTASSLAACMITILGIHNSRKNWGIKGMDADVEKIMESNHSLSQKAKEEIQASALNCPVALSLDKTIIQEVNLKFT